IDWRVFLFLFALCSGVAVAVGLVPALLATRTGPPTALDQAGRRSPFGRSQRWPRDGLLGTRVAVALTLSVGAGLLVRELIRLRATESGMDTRDVLTAHVGHRMTPRQGRPLDEDIRPFSDIEARAAQLPGVRAAGLTQLLPLQSWGWWSGSS